MDIGDFVGTYTVWTANQNFQGNSYLGPKVQVGDTVKVEQTGTNTADITFTGGNSQSYTYHWSDTSSTLHCDFTNIPYTDPQGNPQTTTGRTQVSLMDACNGYKSIYACFIAGDPQQVGVWGADNGGG